MRILLQDKTFHRMAWDAYMHILHAILYTVLHACRAHAMPYSILCCMHILHAILYILCCMEPHSVMHHVHYVIPWHVRCYTYTYITSCHSLHCTSHGLYHVMSYSALHLTCPPLVRCAGFCVMPLIVSPSTMIIISPCRST